MDSLPPRPRRVFLVLVLFEEGFLAQLVEDDFGRLIPLPLSLECLGYRHGLPRRVLMRY